MRPTFLLGAAAALACAAAIAQTPPAGQSNTMDQSAPSHNGMTHAPDPPAESSAASPRPSAWQGTDAEWATHVRNCRQRYGDSYDPATDQYRGPAGRMITCPR